MNLNNCLQIYGNDTIKYKLLNISNQGNLFSQHTQRASGITIHVTEIYRVHEGANIIYNRACSV